MGRLPLQPRQTPLRRPPAAPMALLPDVYQRHIGIVDDPLDRCRSHRDGLHLPPQRHGPRRHLRVARRPRTHRHLPRPIGLSRGLPLSVGAWASATAPAAATPSTATTGTIDLESIDLLRQRAAADKKLTETGKLPSPPDQNHMGQLAGMHAHPRKAQRPTFSTATSIPSPPSWPPRPSKPASACAYDRDKRQIIPG